jgi:hypothetical protein
MMSSKNVWVLVLAGGEGKRLRVLTTEPCGTPVPKQFCSLRGERSLIEEAIDRGGPLWFIRSESARLLLRSIGAGVRKRRVGPSSLSQSDRATAKSTRGTGVGVASHARASMRLEQSLHAAAGERDVAAFAAARLCGCCVPPVRICESRRSARSHATTGTALEAVER